MAELIYKNVNDMTTYFNYCNNEKFDLFTSCNLQNLRRFEFDFDSKSILFAVA